MSPGPNPKHNAPPVRFGSIGVLELQRERPPITRAARAAAILAGLILTMLPGCSGRGTFLNGGPTVGQLKTSVANLEYENAQMKRDLAKLRKDNRVMEDRLVQQEQDNGDLAARLDDARNLLRERGLGQDSRIGRRPDSQTGASGFSDEFRMVPAGQSNRKRRKPPVARIPGSFSPAAPGWELNGNDNAEDDDPGTGMLGNPQPAYDDGFGNDQVGLRLGDDLDHHSSYNGPLRWTPIDPGSRIR